VSGALCDIWGDEAGNLDWGLNGSKLFIVTTLITRSLSLGEELARLRRDLEQQGYELPDGFHATKDKQAVRDEVYKVLAAHDIRVDSTILTKANAYGYIKKDLDRFYKLAWYLHHKFVLPRVVPDAAQPFIAIATLDVKKRRQLHAEALRDVVGQCLPGRRVTCVHWASSSHPCLQAADYCSWAIQRWRESGDPRSYDLIRERLSGFSRSSKRMPRSDYLLTPPYAGELRAEHRGSCHRPGASESLSLYRIWR
jgi:hypothetical protein